MFIDKLNIELEKRNLTLNKLAKGSGVGQATTTRWKNGSLPNADALIKICKYLNVSADYLLDLEPDAPPPLTAQELRLLEYYRLADQRGKETIEDTAQREAARNQTKEISLSSAG